MTHFSHPRNNQLAPGDRVNLRLPRVPRVSGVVDFIGPARLLPPGSNQPPDVILAALISIPTPEGNRGFSAFLTPDGWVDSTGAAIALHAARDAS